MVKYIGCLLLISCFLMVGSGKGLQNSKGPESGKDIYAKYCLTCHQTDGSGVPYTFPSLQKSSWVNGDKARLIKIVLNGLEGDIDVDGESYNGVMPKQDHLTDKQIALVLTYLRQNFGNSAGAINEKEVKQLRGKPASIKLDSRGIAKKRPLLTTE